MIALIRPYVGLFRQNLVAALQFRFAFFSKMATNIFWGYVRASVIVIYYLNGAGEAALTLSQAVSMIWLSQITMNLLPGYGMDFSVWNKIKTGDVGYELLRPIDVYAHWYTNAAAIKAGPFLSAIIPIGAVSLLIPGHMGLSAPASAAGLAGCALALASGLILSCSLICLTYAMSMDVRVGDRVARLFMMLVQIAGGSYLPLQLWPDWMQRFLYWQPFAGIADLPVRLYVGSAPPEALFSIIALQLGWALVMVLVGRVWINSNLRKLVIQGG